MEYEKISLIEDLWVEKTSSLPTTSSRKQKIGRYHKRLISNTDILSIYMYIWYLYFTKALLFRINHSWFSFVLLNPCQHLCPKFKNPWQEERRRANWECDGAELQHLWHDGVPTHARLWSDLCSTGQWWWLSVHKEKKDRAFQKKRLRCLSCLWCWWIE